MGRTIRVVMIASTAVALICLGLLVLAIPQLAGGVVDVPNHWWSALPLLGLTSCITLVASMWMISRRPNASSGTSMEH